MTIDTEVEHAAPLPEDGAHGFVPHDGARIAYSTYGAGLPVILLHGGLGNREDWGNQVPALVRSGYRAVLIDSRGHGRSTRDARPFTYARMAADVLAVMNALAIGAAAFVGWSDGAIVGLTLAMTSPNRVKRVFSFGGNMDLSGVKPVSTSTPTIARALSRSANAYARLSETPTEFKAFCADVGKMMATEPNYSANDLATLHIPIAIVAAEHDELIKREHSEYLARTIPGAELVILKGVSHFAPMQNAREFNDAMIAFLNAQ